MVKIFFRPSVPRAFQQSVESMIRRFEVLFPIWVQEIDVEWKTTSDEWAGMSLAKDYRRVSLFVCQDLFGMSAEFQRDTFLHEVCHCFTQPQYAVAMDILYEFCPPDNDEEDEKTKRIRRLLEARVNEICESVNCDFAHSIGRLIDSLTAVNDLPTAGPNKRDH